MLFYAKRSVRVQLLSLATLAAGACLIAAQRGGLPPIRFNPDTALLLIAAILGAALLDAAVLALHFLTTGRGFVGQIRDTLDEILGGLSPAGVIGAGLIAGIGEELLFRGAIQPWLGLPAAVALFTIAHMGTRPLLRLAVWTAIEGLYLGVLLILTGNLLIPMIVHGVHDTIGILVIQRARAWSDGVME